MAHPVGLAEIGALIGDPGAPTCWTRSRTAGR